MVLQFSLDQLDVALPVNSTGTKLLTCMHIKYCHTFEFRTQPKHSTRFISVESRSFGEKDMSLCDVTKGADTSARLALTIPAGF